LHALFQDNVLEGNYILKEGENYVEKKKTPGKGENDGDFLENQTQNIDMYH
jgi:hypothetical protein